MTCCWRAAWWLLAERGKWDVRARAACRLQDQPRQPMKYLSNQKAASAPPLDWRAAAGKSPRRAAGSVYYRCCWLSAARAPTPQLLCNSVFLHGTYSCHRGILLLRHSCASTRETGASVAAAAAAAADATSLEPPPLPPPPPLRSACCRCLPRAAAFTRTNTITSNMRTPGTAAYWFFRDVGFMRTMSTGVYFAAKPWLAMAVAVYVGVKLTGYKLEQTGHAPQLPAINVVRAAPAEPLHGAGGTLSVRCAVLRFLARPAAQPAPSHIHCERRAPATATPTLWTL